MQLFQSYRFRLLVAVFAAGFTQVAAAQDRLLTPPTDESAVIERLPAVEDEPTYFRQATPPSQPAAGRMGAGMGPNMGQGSRNPAIEAYWLPERNLKSSSSTMQITGGQVSWGAPIARSETTGMWLLTGSWREDHIETDVRLSHLGEEFPNDLQQIRLGLMNLRELANGWSAGGMFNVESASDRPFASINEINFNFLAFLKIPTSETTAWNLSVMYSPLGQISFPIPGIAYQWNPSEELQLNLGVPFSLTYQPRKNWQLAINYMPLLSGQAKLTWTMSDDLSFYAAYRSRNDGYLLADRPDRELRLFEFDQRIVAGLRYQLGPQFILDLSAGYVFDQTYFLGEKFFSGTRFDKIDLEPGLAAAIRLEFVPPQRK